MLHASFQVLGISDLMFGRPVSEPKKDSETHDQFDQRTWRQKVAVDAEGNCVLNPFCVTNGLYDAAKWLKRKVDGRVEFAGRFQKGVTPGRPLEIWIPDSKDKPGRRATVADIDPILLFVPSTGKRGAGTRVPRMFPTLHRWLAIGDCYVWDGKITEEQLSDHLVAVGQFIGWGSMRKQGGGINGCFKVASLTFESIAG